MAGTERDRKSDAALARALHRGDRRAWEDFYSLYADSLFRFALGRARGNAELAADIVQEAIVAAIEQIGRFDPQKGDLWNWLCGIAVNKGRESFRREARASAPPREFARPDPVPSPLDEQASQRLETLAVLSSLAPHYQEALILKYFDDLSVREIALRLQIGEKTVESRLTRAREAFRRAGAASGLDGKEQGDEP